MAQAATIAAHDDLYRGKAGSPALVDVPPARFLMIDGRGSPDGEEFQQAVTALYALAYRSKFALKKAGRADVKVPHSRGSSTFFGILPGRWTPPCASGSIGPSCCASPCPSTTS